MPKTKTRRNRIPATYRSAPHARPRPARTPRPQLDRPAPPKQAAPQERVAGVYIGALAAIAIGTTVALAVMIIAFLTLRSRPVAAAGSFNPKPRAAQKQTPPPATTRGPLHVGIQARHHGLQLQVIARVTGKRGRVVRHAQLSLYTDMVEMPFAHTKGPFAMRPLPGQPGVYGAQTTVPMVGDYKLKVDVDTPPGGSASKHYLVEAANGR
jgi:hypothetical protein